MVRPSVRESFINPRCSSGDVELDRSVPKSVALIDFGCGNMTLADRPMLKQPAGPSVGRSFGGLAQMLVLGFI